MCFTTTSTMCAKRTFSSISDEDSTYQAAPKRICLPTHKVTHVGPLHLNSPPKFAPMRPLPSIWPWNLDTDLDADAPLPPPLSIASRIPAFHIHGSSHCGNHAHEHSFPSGKETNKNKRVGTLCSFCYGPYKQGDLHQLPCGHFTCLSCLEERVRQIPTFMVANAGLINQTIAKMREIMDYLGTMTETAGLASTVRQYWVDEFGFLRQELAILTNMSCSYCQVHIQPSRFMTCLSPEMSRILWLTEEWLADAQPENRRACGWPDCRAYVPSWCHYLFIGKKEVSKAVDAEGRRWWCPSCKGNCFETEEGLNPGR
ncbi:hypothetical protein GE21DRAFT_6754 [Neurospora crassa]|uniref:RING-type domain-containing protein n=2 Tax=Neurospora crassa TaxID=5141 RepID=Q7S8D9_NEUCR|nr:hypothetical protein NCU05186 [Neurospora crassa OR74A]EAA32613.2 hypothetical protein NCU05186 [Neurospora crassa OR74A]KHE79554.1 hypothetical protein GE21DRAFT_6754 [Neurospora crassa]CAF06104.1 hypothetical protein G3C5.130 [Neurospora crassa]|eukprot:XP_961849.2 hypothetical protein NCU05186 [Neurospora crassa OR74A]